MFRLHRIGVLLVVGGCMRAAPAPSGETSCWPSAGQLAVFEDGEFGGRCATLDVGEYASPDRLGIANDSTSSIAIFNGVRALLCSDRAFAGDCVYVAATSARLASNDVVSSLRVERTPDGCEPGVGQIAVYAYDFYGGPCAVLGIGDFAHARDIAIANDSISSVRVGPGAQALLCEHEDWGGACERVTANVRDLAKSRVGNDRVSSIRVVRGGTDCVVRGATPRLAPHVAELESMCAAAYPQILDVLATNAVFAPPLVITFASLPTFTSEARGRDLYIDEDRWDPLDTGIVYHELTHVVTLYPDAPSWLSEGVADYVRGALDGWVNNHCRSNESYTAGYGCAATLLRFAEQRVPGAIRTLHASLRSHPFDGTIAGWRVDDLWDACRREGTCAAL